MFAKAYTRVEFECAVTGQPIIASTISSFALVRKLNLPDPWPQIDLATAKTDDFEMDRQHPINSTWFTDHEMQMLGAVELFDASEIHAILCDERPDVTALNRLYAYVEPAARVGCWVPVQRRAEAKERVGMVEVRIDGESS